MTVASSFVCGAHDLLQFFLSTEMIGILGIATCWNESAASRQTAAKMIMPHLAGSITMALGLLEVVELTGGLKIGLESTINGFIVTALFIKLAIFPFMWYLSDIIRNGNVAVFYMLTAGKLAIIVQIAHWNWHDGYREVFWIGAVANALACCYWVFQSNDYKEWQAAIVLGTSGTPLLFVASNSVLYLHLYIVVASIVVFIFMRHREKSILSDRKSVV